MGKIIHGFVPSPMQCPHCQQGTVRRAEDPIESDLVQAPAQVICPHCHSVVVEHYGRLRPLRADEKLAIDWTEYKKVCADLVAQFGQPTQRCATPPPSSSIILH